MKKYILLTLVFLSLISLSAANRLQTQTNHEYFQLRTGDNFTYKKYAMFGTWNDSTYELTATNIGSEVIPETISYSTSTCAYFGATAPIFYQFYHYFGTPNTPTVPWAVIQIAGWGLYNSYGNFVGYLGDAVDELGNVKNPPEAVITNSPVAGEYIESFNTQKFQSCTNATVLQSNFHWKYKTIVNGTFFGIADTWRTALREFGDTGGNVYNWYFANSLDGPSAYDAGALNLSNMTVSGWRYVYHCNNCTPTPTPTTTPTLTKTPTVTNTPTVTATPNEMTPSATRTPECHYFNSIDNNICVP